MDISPLVKGKRRIRILLKKRGEENKKYYAI